jgi:hypothetical protein
LAASAAVAAAPFQPVSVDPDDVETVMAQHGDRFVVELTMVSSHDVSRTQANS